MKLPTRWPRQGGGGPIPPGQTSRGSARKNSKLALVSRCCAFDSSGLPSNRLSKTIVLVPVSYTHLFRRRENGIWGLTMFTAELQAEAERASRDLEVVDAAARDYAGARPQ